MESASSKRRNKCQRLSYLRCGFHMTKWAEVQGNSCGTQPTESSDPLRIKSSSVINILRASCESIWKKSAVNGKAHAFHFVVGLIAESFDLRGTKMDRCSAAKQIVDGLRLAKQRKDFSACVGVEKLHSRSCECVRAPRAFIWNSQSQSIARQR